MGLYYAVHLTGCARELHTKLLMSGPKSMETPFFSASYIIAEIETDNNKKKARTRYAYGAQ